VKSFNAHRRTGLRLSTFVIVIASLAAVATLAGCSDGVRDQQRSTASSAAKMVASTEEVSLLFSVLAPTMEVAADGTGFRLTIPASSSTAWFTDRPVRNAGSFTVAELVSLWSAEEFDVDPPNAAVVVTVNDVQHQHVVELSDPQTIGTNISFRAVDVGDDVGTDPVANRAATHDMFAGTFTDAELFIDNGTGSPCPSTITYSGFTPCLLPANGKLTFQATVNTHAEVYAQISKVSPSDPNTSGTYTVAATSKTNQSITPWGSGSMTDIVQYYSGQLWTVQGGKVAVYFTVGYLPESSDSGDSGDHY
jgi:hypothetical protein